MMGQSVNLVFTKAAGIKNPTEAGTHSVGYSVLNATAEANDGPMYSTKSGSAVQSANDKVTLGMHSDTAAGDHWFEDPGQDQSQR